MHTQQHRGGFLPQQQQQQQQLDVRRTIHLKLPGLLNAPAVGAEQLLSAAPSVEGCSVSAAHSRAAVRVSRQPQAGSGADGMPRPQQQQVSSRPQQQGGTAAAGAAVRVSSQPQAGSGADGMPRLQQQQVSSRPQQQGGTAAAGAAAAAAVQQQQHTTATTAGAEQCSVELSVQQQGVTAAS